MPLTLDNLRIHHPDEYAADGYPWAAWDLLRAEAPVFWYERHDVEPFWAVTRYADVMTVSNRPDIFINGGSRLRLTLRGKPEPVRAGMEDFVRERGWDPAEPPDMVFMDNPRHRHMRRLSSWAFTQGSMRRMRSEFERLAHEFTEDFMGRLKAAEDGLDFVHELACKLPLAAIGDILGLAPEDWRRILIWSEALMGDINPDWRRPGESRGGATYRAMYEMRTYLEALIAESRANGAARGGVIDHMVHTPVQGALLTDQQLIGYLFLLIGAGNDTTRNALSGGVATLLAHPEACRQLCASPGLIPQAVEEILRWTSPVGSFLRTASEDFELSGTRIAAGDTVGLFYPSANRDARVFADPYRFDITRSPNPHLTFGFGAHFCLGTNLARIELQASLKALLPHLAHLQTAGPAEYSHQTHVLGYQQLPLRYRA